MSETIFHSKMYFLSCDKKIYIHYFLKKKRNTAQKHNFLISVSKEDLAEFVSYFGFNTGKLDWDLALLMNSSIETIVTDKEIQICQRSSDEVVRDIIYSDVDEESIKQFEKLGNIACLSENMKNE
jgi:hypothetical protein